MNMTNIGGEYRAGVYDTFDNNATSRFVNNMLSSMDQYLTSRQLTELHNVLQEVIRNYSISTDRILYNDIDYVELNNELINTFLEDKRLAGLSEKSLEFYKNSIDYVLRYIDKGLDSITSEDIREYFSYLLEERHTSKVTIDNYRRVLNSFYNHCVANGLLYRNPLLKIGSIKKVKKIKMPFTTREIILMREHLINLREKAIFELLLSSGMRVGELVRLNRNDLDMNNCSVIVTGKGDKQRETFFNELAKISIQRYLDSRTDDNPALFVTHNKPYNRIGVSGVEIQIRNIGRRAGTHAHPHKFRRHFATSMIRKGATIEQVQQYLGHAEIETTKMYVVSDESEIQYNHKRYVN